MVTVSRNEMNESITCNNVLHTVVQYTMVVKSNASTELRSANNMVQYCMEFQLRKKWYSTRTVDTKVQSASPVPRKYEYRISEV